MTPFPLKSLGPLSLYPFLSLHASSYPRLQISMLGSTQRYNAGQISYGMIG
jgi:hypothetical protein